MPADDVIQQLTKACDGLLYPSETDAPVNVVTLPKGPPRGATAGGTVDEFFAELEQMEGEDGERWRALHKVVNETLRDAQVYRQGKRRVKVYVIGKTAGGAWAGLQTESVET